MIKLFANGSEIVTPDMIADTLPNLLTGTKDFSGFTNVNTSDNWLSPNGNKTSHSNKAWTQATKYIDADINAVYTLSASIYIVKASENQIVGVCRNTIGGGACANNNTPATIPNFKLNAWLPIYMTFEGLATSHVAFDFEFIQGEADFFIGDYKLVKGNQPSAWSPAPQDLVSRSEFEALQTKVESLTKNQNEGG